ncbi:hypothetical protein L486_00241 [Kwoniella mangroviensis CBS 10435]|uniref:Putative tyrosine-protein phosphatase OCA1 n=1 Tax=Kwoniella mangroviensis CBS 10435 TaxID=1331196 RepID=A0A1B9IYJ6_9TREE|nr:hypothetical protein L486_00241 [Kwoniella mangroviensis CBS 10435]
MLTPPYHFSIVASPSSLTSNGPEILYRGSIPAPRNKSFIKRLNLRTIVVLRKKALKEDDPLVIWSRRRGIQIKWIKAEEMGEEKLGMGKNEVLEVLKIILDIKSYPLYIADIDGISHTTLIVACLRKLQGWNMECIINEICRFEPEYLDLPLLPFIQSFLSLNTSDPTLILPQPPYPGWLWPGPTTQSGQGNISGSNMGKSRDRSGSTLSSSSTQSTTNTTSLPFPHPLSIRKHPTMKLTFPILPPPPPSTAGQGVTPPMGSSPMIGLSRVNSRRDKIPLHEDGSIIGQSVNNISDTTTNNQQSQADESVKTQGEIGNENKLGRTVSFHSISERQSQSQSLPKQAQVPEPKSKSTTTPTPTQSNQSSPLKLSREQTHTTSTTSSDLQSTEGEEDTVEDGRLPRSEYQDDDDEYYEDEDEDEYEEEEEEEDEDDDDEGNEPTSQYISALDLAGFG